MVPFFFNFFHEIRTPETSAKLSQLEKLIPQTLYKLEKVNLSKLLPKFVCMNIKNNN